MDKKKLRNDIILVVILLIATIIPFIILNINSKVYNPNVTIYVQNNIVAKVDLSHNEEKDFYIKGLKGDVHVHTKDGAIAIIESNCPHQDCVRMGYVSEANHPIICAYNAVYIVIDGQSNYDVEIG